MNNQIDDDLILDGLTPEDLIESGRKLRKLLLDSMMPQERWARVSVADILHLFEQDEQIRDEVMANVPPEKRLAGMAPEERLAGMTPEELAILQEEIVRQLRQTKTPE